MIMTRCLWICGAYSYRLTRRHSTLLLIVAFIITLTIILHLYAYKHKEHPKFPRRNSDYEYKPGSFLAGHQPNENKSYCEFNYGLPNSLKWGSFQLSHSPESGSKGPYRVIYNAVRGTAYDNYTSYNTVTYVTHATPEFLYHIIEIAKFWEGPISLAVFVPNYDLDTTMQIMNQLCRCYSGMAKVSVHLFYPKRHPPTIRQGRPLFVPPTTEAPTTTSNITIQEMLQKKLENYRNLDNHTRARYIQWVRKKKVERMMSRLPKKENFVPSLCFEDCSGLNNYDFPTFRQEHNLIYPVNVGRNVARNASITNYVLVSDIEMVPSEGLATNFMDMLRRLMGNKRLESGCIFAQSVFVVPLFEVEKGEEIPRNKETLVRMVTENRAMYFHQKVCSHCQRFPGLQTWLQRPSPTSRLEPMLIARREYPYHRWEPIYFGTKHEPWYSEILSWEGRQDKMTQMLELCLQEYRMVVLDGGFLCHAAVSKNVPRYNGAQRVNTQRYLKIINALKQKYPNRPLCKVMWGC